MIKKSILRREATHFISNPESTDIDTFVRKLFFVRGEKDNTAQDYQLSGLLKPDRLKGLDQAITLLAQALEKQEKIVIVGDFDADGATSTALLYRCLRQMGFLYVDYLIPNRFEFGYGLTPEIVDLSQESAPNLIITVDNGISSHEGVARAKTLGIKVLVTDHHLPGQSLPDADAIVNPNQPGCEFPSKNLAGVGVIFYLMVALRSHLRDQGYFENKKLTPPNMAQFLDLLALGTVADVVPLDFNNRILVAQGIARIQNGYACAGIQSILAIAGKVHSSISSTDLGFAIGPRLNAAGRLDDMSLGVRCLITDSELETNTIAEDLNALNEDRKLIESGMQAEAMNILDNTDTESNLASGMCLFKSEWHQGVIGILASRIKDKLHRPTIVFAETDDGSLKGSGRSIPGIHLRDVLDEIASQHPEILTKFGGHAMAAGLSLAKSDLEAFKLIFDKVVAKKLTVEMASPVILSDGELTVKELEMEYIEAIKKAGPWGQHFPEPIFDGVFEVVQQRIVGQKHLKLVLIKDQKTKNIIDAIAFNVDLDVWPNENARFIKIAYKMDINEFRGRKSLQLIIDYLEPVDSE